MSTNVGSADSNYSQPSFDSFDELVDREFAAVGLRGQPPTQNAASVLERCKTKPVAFAVRTNIEYVPAREDNCPIRENAIQFDVKDFIHIKDKYDAEWWVGRLVKVGAPLGFVPSPMKLERIRLQASRKSKMISASGSKNKSFVSGGDLLDSVEPEGSEEIDTTKTKANMFISKEKKKPFFKKTMNLTAPYDVVPNMRPVILVGPSLKGYDVTDMMQKAIFDFLRRRYEGSIIITKVTADISMAKRGGAGGLGGRSGLSVMERGGGTRNPGTREVSDEIERIFELARSLNLLVLDCDTINHPAQMQKTSLAPIIAYLKVSSPKVLQKLIKSRGKSQVRNLNVQLVAAEKLTQCPPEVYDIILDQNQLEDACNHLAEYLDTYWEATHPKYDEAVEMKLPPQPAFARSVNMPVVNPTANGDESVFRTIATLHSPKRTLEHGRTYKNEFMPYPNSNEISAVNVFTVPLPSQFNTLTMPPNTALTSRP